MKPKNNDQKTIEGFGEEWNKFDQSSLNHDELKNMFEKYFHIFPWDKLPKKAKGFDMGCGSGRWAKLVAPRIEKLHCIEPSSAINVAKRNLADHSNCVFHKAKTDNHKLPNESMDFGYSLGVLHHIPNTFGAIEDCVKTLKNGAPFLVYLYYAFDNCSIVYRILWRLSDALRVVICRLPWKVRLFACQLIALSIYWPLARFAFLIEWLGVSKNKVEKIPLNYYRRLSLYTMRTDALDRFGTRLEKRFTRIQIKSMMEQAGLKNIKFSEQAPFWCALGIKGK